ncbi:uncharacterized protein Z518_05796 [Rhinocladiella mackenziei CBS 650.93]|uniref:D-xylose reductase [NAD(P)H] n=1 Tax=Rhinocladiella mackenziei CBS 650.93 TaxID=1442369 RepID=A0A0D2J755_9EURO|nr:uncharacterized protein Z518_05796 [Rhinocladiella mackenziei CBS 650.93]KIX04925.1 hypothetical protein Z518_05796 [Rhinocladiella mackenziei CBS 650.93]
MLTRYGMQASARLLQVARQIPNQTRTIAGYTKTQFPLNTGAEIPAIGFGTWQDKNAQEDAVCEALKVGYRHIDTARIYGTEPSVAKGIKRSGVPRSDIFITTKLWNNSHHPDDVEKACDASLKDLDTDYIDLYLMHWPSPFARGNELRPKKDNQILTGDTDYVDTYQAMEKLVANGKCKAIGVSNFSRAEMDRLLRESSIIPAAHQLECHPYLQQPEFVSWHHSQGIHVTQYSPFGNSNEVYDRGKNMGKLIDDPVLQDIGRTYGKNGAQVALAWGIARGNSVIPKSKTPSRIKANLEGDFKLGPEDVKKIDALDKKLRFNDPSKSFGWVFYADLDGKKM